LQIYISNSNVKIYLELLSWKLEGVCYYSVATLNLQFGKWMDDSAVGAIFWQDAGIHLARPSRFIMGILYTLRKNGSI